MSTRRKKTEMLALDEKIRPLYEAGIGCRLIEHALDENPVIILKRVRRMGIVRSRDVVAVDPPSEFPFKRKPDRKNLRKSAIGFVSRWFLERGYIVSVPIETTSYDLVAESDEGLKRVQVKTTTKKERGRWIVNCSRLLYDKTKRANAGGKRRRTVYSKSDTDIIAAVTVDFDLYLVPIGHGLPGTLTLDRKYQHFKM